MKAKVKKTGEVVNVRYCGNEYSLQVAERCYRNEYDGMRFLESELEFIEDIPQVDWEQRRYEIAKELMRGFATNPHNMLVDAKIGTLAEWSVSGADTLIAELKKGGMK